MKSKIVKTIKEWIITIVLGVIVYFGLTTYVVQASEILTGSMIPTLNISERVMMEKFLPTSTYSFGDVIIFNPPEELDEGIPYVKRLIGLPGDTIEIKNGTLIRNGEEVYEPYIKETMRYEFGPVTVPDDHFFFLGDNRNNSNDSHLWTNPFIHKDKVIGRALFRYYPLNRIGGL